MFGLSRADKLHLSAAVPILEAEEWLKSGNVPDKQLYDVVLHVTGSEERAAAALADRIESRLAKGQRPDV